jgi:hypothetical protein
LTVYAVKSILAVGSTLAGGILAAMVEVEVTEEFEAWFMALSSQDGEAVVRVVACLRKKA